MKSRYQSDPITAFCSFSFGIQTLHHYLAPYVMRLNYAANYNHWCCADYFLVHVFYHLKAIKIIALEINT